MGGGAAADARAATAAADATAVVAVVAVVAEAAKPVAKPVAKPAADGRGRLTTLILNGSRLVVWGGKTRRCLAASEIPTDDCDVQKLEI